MHLKPSLWGVAFALLAVPFFTRVDNLLLSALDMQGLALAFCIACVLGLIAKCLLSSTPRIARWEQANRNKSLLLTSIIAGLGFGLLVFSSANAHLVATGTAGVLLGAGLQGYLWQWGIRFSQLPLVAILLNVSVGLLGASVLWYILMHIQSQQAFLIVLAALTLGGNAFLLLAPGGTSQTFAPKAPLTIKEALSKGWSYLFGLLFVFFTLGLTFWPLAAGLDSQSISFKPAAYMLFLLIAFLALGSALRNPNQATQSNMSKRVLLFCQISLPLAAAIALACPFLSNMVTFADASVFSAFFYLGIAPFYCIGLTMIFFSMGAKGAARDSRVSTQPALFSLALASCGVSLLLGFLVFSLFKHDAQIVSLCVLAVYLVAMSLEVILRGARGSLRGETPASRKNQCAQLAHKASLSPRETEVLEYLARGHGTRFISEELFISTETVRTHLKRIYEKTGAHTREELLRLLNAQD